MEHYVTKGFRGKNWEYGETSIHLQPFAFVSLVSNHPEVTDRGVQLLLKTCDMIHKELAYENSNGSSGKGKVVPVFN
jgi:hypothetical protein